MLNANDLPVAVPLEAQRNAMDAGLAAAANINTDSSISVSHLRYAIVLIGAPSEANQYVRVSLHCVDDTVLAIHCIGPRPFPPSHRSVLLLIQAYT